MESAESVSSLPQSFPPSCSFAGAAAPAAMPHASSRASACFQMCFIMFSSKTKKRGQLPVFPTHHMVCPVGNYTRVVPRFVFMIYPNVFVLMPLAAAHVSMAEPDGQVIVTPITSSTSPQQ